MIRIGIVAITFITSLINHSCVYAHARWKCPPPRDALDSDNKRIVFNNTGNKIGPCGPITKWGYGNTSTIKPGWITISWEESVSHKGSPFRIALLNEQDTTLMILLNHIPHNDATAKSVQPDHESTYASYKVSLLIPDINCAKCSLQLLYVMTDKTTSCGIESCVYDSTDAACKGSIDADAPTCAGAPNSDICHNRNACFSNYYSCTDIIITGTKSMDNFDLNQQPVHWPYNSLPLQNYTNEESPYWSIDGTLLLPTESNNYQPFITNYETFSCLKSNILSKADVNKTISKMLFILGIIVLDLIVIFIVAYFIKKKFYDFHYHSLLTRPPANSSRDDEIQLQTILDRQTTSKLASSYYEEEDYDEDDDHDITFNSAEKGTLNRLEMYRKNLVDGHGSNSTGSNKIISSSSSGMYSPQKPNSARGSYKPFISPSDELRL